MADPTQAQLIAELSRDLVAQTAPQELPLFRPISEAYFKDPEKTLKREAGKDEMLGFGAGVAVTFLTPIVLAIMTQVVSFLIEEIGKSLRSEGSSLTSDIVKRMFRKFRGGESPEGKAPPALTPQQLAQVRELALEKAQQLNLPPNQAGLLADSIVGSLAVTA
jgi:hypothetical protein